MTMGIRSWRCHVHPLLVAIVSRSLKSSLNMFDGLNMRLLFWCVLFAGGHVSSRRHNYDARHRQVLGCSGGSGCDSAGAAALRLRSKDLLEARDHHL